MCFQPVVITEITDKTRRNKKAREEGNQTRQDKIRQFTSIQDNCKIKDKTRQSYDMTRQDNTREKTRRGEARRDNTTQQKTRQDHRKT